MNKYVEDCPCGNTFPHSEKNYLGAYRWVCDKCKFATKWFYEREKARRSWNRRIRYKQNKKQKGVSMNDRFNFRCFDTDIQKFIVGFRLCDHYKWPNGIIEQCTGLKDKNGRLIYEGDIVCWTRAQTDGDVDSICPIVFDNDMCSFGPLLNGHSLWMPHQTDLRMEVLGNIHENPELLEAKK